MKQPPQLMTFLLTSSQPRAWLVIGDAKKQSQVIEMSKAHSNRWSASVCLIPGEYRCRYYCGDDRHVTYHGPAHLDGVVGDAMDASVSVQSSPAMSRSDLINILLVEDNPATRAALTKLLQKDGYAVHSTEGYQTALTMAKGQHLDLAICDINLGDGDGSDLLRELKAIQPMQGIAVTGYTLPEETEHYREAGFSTVLHKPTHYPELKSAISALMASVPTREPCLETLPR